MREKTVKRLVWIMCLTAPLLPTYLVMEIIYPLLSIIGVIIISCIEYFGFMYIIALFIQRIAMAKQHKEQQLKRNQESFKE
jgi:sensor histidine kinase YesM